MITNEQKKKAWEYGSKSKDHYNVLTSEQKKAFWEYGKNNNLYDSNNLDDYKKNEYNTYLGTPKPIKTLDTSRPSMVSGGRPMPTFDQKKLDKASGTAGAFVSNLVDSATLGLATKGLNKFENGLGDKALADASQGHKVASTIGNLAGYTVPFGAASKVVGAGGKALVKAGAKPLTNKLLKTSVVGATEGALVGGAEGGIKDKNIVKSAGEMALLGAGGNLAVAGASKLIGKVLKPRVLETPKVETKLNRGKGLTGKLPNKALEQSKTLTQSTTPINNNIIGNGSLGTNKTISSKTKGQELPNGEKLRSFPITAENSNLSPEYSKILSKQADSYKPISNTETWESATKNVANDSNKAHNDFMQSGKYKQTADDTALGEALIVDAIKKGDFAKANDVTAELADRLTTAGQQIQAASIINRLSPEGMLLYAQKQVNRVNRELDKGLKNKLSRKVILTPEDTKMISDVMNKVKDMPDGYDKEVEIAKVMKLIGTKIPKSLMSKVSTFQTVAMLGNPKTMVRNTLGNALFSGAENASNVVGAGIDKLISIGTKKQTTLFPSIGTQLKGAKNGAKRVINDFKNNVDTSPNRTQFDLPQIPAFENVPVLGKAEKLTTYGLKLGDTPFWQATYDESLRQQMKIAKVLEPTTEMKEQAGKLANYRTYQDTNKVTEMFTGLKKSFNKLGTKDFGLGDLILKFPKTPANILARAIDYSPASAINLMSKAMKGTIDQKQLVDGLSRMVVGTGIGVGGYKLGEMGIATGRANKDKDVASLEKQAGQNPYSLKLGDKNLTYDWAQPLSMPFSVGANISKNKQDMLGLGETIMNAVSEGTNTLSEQSVMQGVKRFFNGQGTLSENVGNSLAGLPASFIPSILKQFGQLTDDNTRDTYSDNFIEKNITNQVKNKIPILRNTLPNKVDTLGNNIKEFQGNNNVLNVFLNPGTLTNNVTDKNQKFILDIYNKTEDKIKTHFPRIAPDKDINNKALPPLLRTELQREMGIKTNEMLNNMASRYDINSMTDKQLENLADVIKNRLTKIQKSAKVKILPKELRIKEKD